MNNQISKEIIDSEIKIYDRLFPFGFILLMSIYFVILGWSEEISLFGNKLSLLNFAYIFSIAAPFYFGYINRIFNTIRGVLSQDEEGMSDNLYDTVTSKGLFNIYYSPTKDIPINGSINKFLLFMIMFTSIAIMISFIRETAMNKYILGILGLYLGKSHISTITNIVKIDKLLLASRDKVIPTTGITIFMAIAISIVLYLYLN